SPVQQEVIKITDQYHVSVVLVKSFSHFSHASLPSHVSVQYVDKGAEMADFKIMSIVKRGDIIITQDYGLASVLLGKGCYVMHHKGFQYTEHNIDRLLSYLHYSDTDRRARLRTKDQHTYP